MRTSSMDYYSLDTYLNMGQFQFLALDAEIRELVEDLEALVEEQYWYERADEKGNADSDIYERRYYERLSDFKKKWLQASNEDRMFRLMEHIDRRMDNMRSELYDAIGVPPAARPKGDANG